MDVPVGSFVVINSIYNHSVVTPRIYKVIVETAKSVEITALTDQGEIMNAENSKTIRKSSIVSVLTNLDEFEPFKKMNDEVAEKFRAYQDLFSRYEKEVNIIRAKTQGK